MLRILKNGFIPHGAITTHSKMNDEIKYEALKFAAEISRQINQNGTVNIEPEPGNPLSEAQLAALSEIIAHELIYYHQIGEIGCFLASALLEEENDNASIESDQEDDTDCGVLSGHPSSSNQGPKVGHLTSSLLIASGKIRKNVHDLLRNMACPQEIYLLGPAGYENALDYLKQRHYHGLLVHPLFIQLGGGSFKSAEIKADINHILTQLAAIAKDAWTLMNLCGMLQIFRLSTSTSLFNSIKIYPIESIFGNNGWRQILPQQAATMISVCETHDVLSSSPKQTERDEVPSSSPKWAYPLDYYDSFEEVSQPWDYCHSEEAS